MIFFNIYVISKKIYIDNYLLKVKSFAASFGIHAVLFAGIAILMSTHPIPLIKSNEKITISLSEFSTTTGDLHRMKTVSKPKEPFQNVTPPIAEPKYITTTLQKTPSQTPSVSPEASAPLAHTPMPASTPSLSNVQNDSPHFTSTPPEHELPRNTVPDNQIGGAALGHIRAMIENTILYSDNTLNHFRYNRTSKRILPCF